MRRVKNTAALILFVVAYLLAGTLHAGEFSGLAAGLLALHSKPSPLPPVPAPLPGKRCQNCNGTGRLGDGTTFVDCPECDGGIVKSSPADCGPERCDCGTACNCPNCPHNMASRPAVAAPAPKTAKAPASPPPAGYRVQCGPNGCSLVPTTSAPTVIRSRPMTQQERRKLFPNRR